MSRPLGVVMNKTLALASLLLLSTGAALAADPPENEPPVVPEVFDWSGFYAGFQGGGAFLNIDRETLPQPGFMNSYTAVGFLLGAHIGANRQQDQWVFGVEADVNWSNATGNDAGVGGSVDTTTMNWLGTLRGRVGVTAGKALAFVTAGVAAAGITNNNGGPPPGTDSDIQFGFTGGLGVEVAVTDTVRIRSQYLFSALGTRAYQFNNGFLDANSTIFVHAATAGVSVGF